MRFQNYDTNMWILKYTEKKNKNAIITSDSSVVESSSDLMG